MPDERPDQFDSETLRKDLARIRATLKRLDGERRSNLDQLEQAILDAERLLAERHDPPPSTGL
jgi:hypothetical protein